jgi:hypothetical protein
MLLFILILVGVIAALWVTSLVVNLLVHGAGSAVDKALHKRDRRQG